MKYAGILAFLAVVLAVVFAPSNAAPAEGPASIESGEVGVAPGDGVMKAADEPVHRQRRAWSAFGSAGGGASGRGRFSG